MPRYNLFDRTMIRLIMTMTGGPTDMATVIDYTPWERMAELATEFARLSSIGDPSPAGRAEPRR